MKKFLILILITATTFSSCLSDLDTKPEVELTLEELLKQDPNAISGILSRLYASYALSGVQGPGSSDIDDDAGESPFLRGIVNLQDFTADGMKNRWGDDGLDQLTTTSNWDENNKFFRYLYNRIYYTIPQANNLLSVMRNVTVNDQENIISEVRFLRALAYYYLIDAFGNGVLATEENIGTSQPLPQATREELFNYVESELLAIEPTIAASNGYGRANKAVVQMLLAKLYLNAEVYTGTARYNDAGTFIKKVIDEGGYSLAPQFVHNFSGDNDTSPEVIFPLIADAVNSQSYGNTTYIINGSLSSDTMNLDDYGATGGWGGHRASSGWYGKYCGGLTDVTALIACADDRAKLFWTDGHEFNMTDYKEWTDGFPSIKFRNTNVNGSTTSTEFANTDFPLFRLADAYLIYAECALRGASSADMSTALSYVNMVRNRANASTITQSELTLDFIIDERARELNLEGHRRSDLIRFGMFTGGTYLWPWKGNTANGTAIPATYKLFPIPLTALEANPNLTQNPGY
ncbi:RagB/SusD family nutrient uptake outer membrane protein [Tenacibaculum xiamenense]|uniref:RagB/SusD family nutrient uptake outer membrane protein n=1 Tax=Tenacibaculum xiamenense TaxID=1261553 RepID=UPI0038952D9D